MFRHLRDIGLATLGGACGGAAAGLAEAVVIAATGSEFSEFQFIPYALIGYGLLGALFGVGLGVARSVLVGFELERLPTPFGLGAGVPFAAIVFIVLRYHVDQRFFHEELSLFTPSGALAHLGLLALSLIGLWVSLLMGRGVAASPRRSLTALGSLIAAVVVALVIGVSRTPNETVTGPGPVTRAAAGRPNVILIITDTLRADAIGVYGGSTPTPNLDALAQSGVRFAHAYSQSSWTRPSIATIFTSLYPASHGTTTKASMLPDRVETLAESLRGAGYNTAAFVTNINIAPIFNFQQGFAEYTYLAPAFYFWASDSSARLALYRIMRVVRERFFARSVYAENFYQDARTVTDRASAWLDAKPKEPFFLLVHYMDPHDPYFEIPYDGIGVARVTNPNPPAGRKEELRAMYQENIGYLDGFLGDLWTRLRDLGLYDKSLIVLTADHGEEFMDHGGWWHGTTLYDEQLHVPLLVKRPNDPAAGSVEDQRVGCVDVAPTVLSVAGLPAPAAFQGEDVFSAPPDRVFFAEEDLEGNLLSSIRDANWKLITANENNPRGLPTLELFDLQADPKESRNLSVVEPQRAADMLAQLSKHRGVLSPGAVGR